jgi:hypothetical protein
VVGCVWHSKADHFMVAGSKETRGEGARDELYSSRAWPHLLVSTTSQLCHHIMNPQMD